MPYREIILFSRSVQNTQNHCGQKVEIFVVTFGGTQRNIDPLKSQIVVVFVFAVNKDKKLWRDSFPENVLPHSDRAAFRLRHFSPFHFQLDTSSAKLSSFHGPKISWFINLSQEGAMSDGNRQRLSGSAVTCTAGLTDWLWLFVHYIVTVSVVTLRCLCCIVC